MTLIPIERTRRPLDTPFRLVDAPSKAKYAIFSAITLLAVRLLENAVHEYAHAAVIMLSGGDVVGIPTVSPFGGFTKWRDVPSTWLPAVNLAGTAASVVVMLALFLPALFRAGHQKARWIAYWGVCVAPVNAVAYWFVAPLVTSAEKYDPVAFARNMGITPIWIVGIVATIPLVATACWMAVATRLLQRRILVDPDNFHVVCLAAYYAITLGLTIVSYAGMFDELVFRGL